MYRNCPECKEDWNGKVCRGCGYKAAGVTDDSWRLCANESQGLRCANPGVVSSSTLGGSGFFCWQHAPVMRHYADGKACPPPMGFDALRAISRPKLLDAEAVAERLAIANE